MTIKEASQSFMLEAITSLIDKYKEIKVVGSYTSVLEPDAEDSDEVYKKWVSVRKTSFKTAITYVVDYETEQKEMLKKNIDTLPLDELASIIKNLRF